MIEESSAAPATLAIKHGPRQPELLAWDRFARTYKQLTAASLDGEEIRALIDVLEQSADAARDLADALRGRLEKQAADADSEA